MLVSSLLAALQPGWHKFPAGLCYFWSLLFCTDAFSSEALLPHCSLQRSCQKQVASWDAQLISAEHPQLQHLPCQAAVRL